MWFCAFLLFLSLAYAVMRRVWPGAPRVLDAPDNRSIAAFIVVMALATFLVRIAVPETVSVLNMHPGDFPQYILMFAAGVVAWRGRWFDRLSPRTATRWALGTLMLSLPLLVLLVVTGGALQHETAQYGGGLNLVSAGKSLWEALVCVGMTFALVGLYRRYFDRQGVPAEHPKGADAKAVPVTQDDEQGVGREGETSREE